MSKFNNAIDNQSVNVRYAYETLFLDKRVIVMTNIGLLCVSDGSFCWSCKIANNCSGTLDALRKILITNHLHPELFV